MACGNPRVATERAERFNKMYDEDGDEDCERNIEVSTWDLKDFFTNISRNRFKKDVNEPLRRIRERHPDARFF